MEAIREDIVETEVIMCKVNFTNRSVRCEPVKHNGQRLCPWIFVSGFLHQWPFSCMHGMSQRSHANQVLGLLSPIGILAYFFLPSINVLLAQKICRVLENGLRPFCICHSLRIGTGRQLLLELDHIFISNSLEKGHIIKYLYSSLG